MRKIFRGKLGLVGAVLVSLALVAMITGTVAAATGYVLWEGSSEITVTEPIHVYWGSTLGTYPNELDLGDGDPLGASVGMTPGVCVDTYFKVTSDSPYGLLVKATSTSSNSTMVSVSFNATSLDTTGVVVTSTNPLYVTRTVCVNGTADLGMYTASTGFTRESAP